MPDLERERSALVERVAEVFHDQLRNNVAAGPLADYGRGARAVLALLEAEGWQPTPPRGTVEDVALVPDDKLRPLLVGTYRLLDAADRALDVLSDRLKAASRDRAEARRAQGRAVAELLEVRAERDEALALAQRLYPAPVDVPGGAG